MTQKGERDLERGAAADLWRHTLSQIPSIFGRLVYLASLRDANSGTYEHHGLALVFGADEADRTLKESHRKAFSDWLRFGLEHQKADLDLYFSGLSTDKRTLLTTWVRLSPYLNFIPFRTSAAERKLYVTDLETLLEMLRNEYGVSDSGQDA
ncbi:MAG: hypothetical protein R2729_12160 [Bryobacteraceae bacterium]